VVGSGVRVGLILGEGDEASVGSILGDGDEARVGSMLGDGDETRVGSILGDGDEARVGSMLGDGDETRVVGSKVGSSVGAGVPGSLFVGLTVGVFVGFCFPLQPSPVHESSAHPLMTQYVGPLPPHPDDHCDEGDEPVQLQPHLLLNLDGRLVGLCPPPPHELELEPAHVLRSILLLELHTT